MRPAHIRIVFRVVVLAGLALGLNAGARAAGPAEQLKEWAAAPAETNWTAAEAIVRQSLGQPLSAVQVEMALLALLAPDVPLDARRFACRQLRLLGTDRAIPGLARWLGNAHLAHLARAALEAMPSPAASAALRQALPAAKGDLQIGLVNSLGQRREASAVPVLVNLLNQRDITLIRAVIAALGQIGDATALDALLAVAAQFEPGFGSGVLTRVSMADEVKLRLDGTLVADALLQCADSFLRAGKKEVAAGLHSRIYAAPFVSRAQRLAALRGLARADPVRALPLLLKTLQAPDPAVQAFGAGCVGELPAEAGAQLLPLIDAFAPAVQVGLIEALAERQGKGIMTNLLRAARSPEPVVQIAAIRSLGRLEVAAEAVQLLARIAAGTGPVADAAQESLGQVRGAAVDDALLACLAQEPPAVRVAVVRAAAARRMVVAIPALRRASEDKDPAVRDAAIEALAVLGAK